MVAVDIGQIESTLLAKTCVEMDSMSVVLDLAHLSLLLALKGCTRARLVSLAVSLTELDALLAPRCLACSEPLTASSDYVHSGP